MATWWIHLGTSKVDICRHQVPRCGHRWIHLGTTRDAVPKVSGEHAVRWRTRRVRNILILLLVAAMACGRLWACQAHSRGASSRLDKGSSSKGHQIDGSSCSLEAGAYLAVPKEPSSPESAVLPALEFEVTCDEVAGRIAVERRSGRSWHELKDPAYQRDMPWCVSFQAPLFGAGDSVVAWLPVQIHVLEATDDGYLALVVWAHYDGRADEYLLRRKSAVAADRLPNIIEFRILDENRVYLRAGQNRGLYRITAEGGLYDDRHYIGGETGTMKPIEGARASGEIVLKIGERVTDGLTMAWNQYKLKSIDDDTAEFHHTGIARGNKKIDRVISVRPYKEAGDQTGEERASRKTALFRSDWRKVCRAEVTEDLVAMLRIGMTKENVASLLELPSRSGDEIIEDGDSEEWVFTITLGRILILRFESGKLTNIDGG